ncbi:hypothetical protein L5G32_11345 [Gordonia sp. HY002]|uniref:hypothetical protein n=1 Tax=Gordonia zhenghanii TaxID=2911516 RepID=UPI001EF0F1D8|nr:hypothetical protein [Gordonia zhenghanii]MCF8570861.1 hypothetical protein [Gordonia zhenghanii]MCF8607413.1 hypothetical protein [Gordonia zhenghanii]
MKGVRSAVVGVALLAAAMLITGCSDDSSTVPASAESVSDVSAGAPSAERSDVERVAAIQVCRQVITSAGVMVRDYNTFMKQLNKTQSYESVGSEDRWAVETLETGADVVRKAVSPATPTDLVDDVSEFVDSSEKLAERIGRKQRAGLNRASDEWDDKRSAALDGCAEYLPTQ